MKRSAKLFVMLGVLCVLVGAVLLQKLVFPAENEDGDTDSDASSVTYAANDVISENVTAISYEKDGVLLSFKKNGDTWVLDEENAPNIDSELVSAMVVAISSPAASYRFEGIASDKLAQYGLDEPAIRVSVSEGTKTRTFIFGEYNKTAEEYYFCDEADKSLVHTVISSSYEAFAYTLEDLIIYDTLPEISADSVTAFTLEGTDGKITVTAIKTPSDENELGYEFSAELERDGEKEEYSYADFYRMASAVEEWNIDEFVTFDASKSSEYGFDTPALLTVSYTERNEIEAEGASGGYIETEKSFTLVLGGTDEDGYSYVKTDADSRLIYKLSSNVFSEIFGLS